ncbi:hypothetical protein C7974DRAFT_89795 [Boeremia exigua]|uniref:uncharacterized protein n=1 Tax=Boeremia exigua TaxID=749465 RepID=UPI001E8D1057|nr:uncharacterized protein C7974DRAFT_89795 [Boeremia exigua]KAH6612016.1 hypothetical protein C7974DRAFT_89795 [Boeremia exigua]
MIFQRRFHSQTHAALDSPPTPPPKDKVSPSKTLEEILAIAVSPRAPKPPPHAVGTVAIDPRLAKSTPIRAASSPLRSNVPRRVPSSRKTGHATIHTDAIDGHDAFESDAFAIHMPTTRIPIIDAPVSRSKLSSPTRAQAEAVRTYTEKAKEARERNNSIGVRVPPNIASYDYAYAGTSKTSAAIPAVLKPSSSPPAPAGAFPVSPPVAQGKWTPREPRSEPVVTTSKVSSNTSVYRKPNIAGVTTAAAVIEECVHFVRADAKGGASRPTTPPKSTIVKVSMKANRLTPPEAPAVPKIKIQACQDQFISARTCDAEPRREVYRSPYVEPSRSPSPTKTMPNFTRQYSIEGDSIFGYKVKDPLGTIGGADKSASNSSDDEKPKASASKTQSPSKPSPVKRTLTDRWPWIRKGASVGKPPSAPAPDPPVRAPSSKRPRSIYVSPFASLDTPPKTPSPTRPAAPYVSVKKTPTVLRRESPAAPAVVTSESFDRGLQQIQSFVLLGLKIGLALYVVVALWFILDAIREALCVVSVPLQIIATFVWTMMTLLGRGLGMAAGVLGGKIRVLRRG